MNKPNINKVNQELAARQAKLDAADKERERIRARIAEVRTKFHSKETANKRK